MYKLNVLFSSLFILLDHKIGKFFILCIISCILKFLRVGRLYFMSYAGKDEVSFLFRNVTFVLIVT